MTDATAREQAREALVKALDAADKPDVMLRAFARDESIHGVLGQGAIDYLDANPAAKAALAAWADAETRELMADAVTGAATVGMHFPALNLALGIPDTAMQAIDQSRRDWYERATPAGDGLLQALWDCGVASGMDTDGDDGPGAMIAGMGPDGFARAMVENVQQLHRDYDECLAASQPRNEDGLREALNKWLNRAWSGGPWSKDYIAGYDAAVDEIRALAAQSGEAAE